MINNPLANAMSNILNSERVSKKEVTIKPVSKVILAVLQLMNDNHFIGEVKLVEDTRGNYAVVSLLGNINRCGVVMPRHAVAVDNFEKFEKRFLPAIDFGMIVVSTPKGIMTHNEAKKKGTGGRLLAFCY